MDDCSHDDESRNLLDEEKQIAHREPQPRRWYQIVYFLSILFSNLVTLIVAFKTGQAWQSNQRSSSFESLDRPLYADIDRESMHSFNFSAFSLHSSRWTAPPDNEVDQAWRELGVEYHTFLVPVSEGPAFGISEDHVVIPADAPGVHGKSGYAVDMEAMHQLHCLNLLRKGQFFNYPYYSSPEHNKERPSWAFRDPEQNLKGHINHCIDALRERIMCAADNDVLPYYWRDREGLTISDFAVSRQCKNFEAVRSWAEEHQIDDWGFSYRLTTPDGAYIASDLLDSN